jgi:hypothetical protein
LSKKSVPSVTFTVGSLTKPGWIYDAARNAASSITVLKP